MRFEIRQSTRVLLLLIDILFLTIFSKLALGAWFPPVGNEGFWFYAALLSLLLGSRLVTPFYTKPVDAISYSVAALVAMFLVNDWSAWESGEKVLFAIVVAYCGLVGLAAFIQILIKDSTREWVQVLSANLRSAVDLLGSPKAVFSLVILFALYAFHRMSADQLLWIGIAWALTVAFSPLDTLLTLGKKIRYQWLPGNIPNIAGEIVAYQNPNIVLYRQCVGEEAGFGAPVIVNDQYSSSSVAITLDFVGRDKGILRRAVQIDAALPNEEVLTTLTGAPSGSVLTLSAGDIDCSDAQSRAIINDLDDLVGIVAPETSIERLYFEVAKNDDLEEGRLVETFIGGKSVIYQVVDGLTKEEIVQQKNTHGYARAQAQKIGVWDDGNKRFELAKWLPMPNSPVFLKKSEEMPEDPDAIGHFPSTNYTVGISNVHELVTHNTAILGILGVGKSMLSIELVERMIAEGIKVICLDLTNQYQKELSEFYDEAYEAKCIEKIQKAGDADQDEWDENPAEGGSVSGFAEAIEADLREFLDDDNPRCLKIYNPAQLFATKQINEPRSFQSAGQWQRQAALWAVTPVEVTRIVSEAALALVQDQMVDKARVCLVYEEAHSLVPEWNSVASDGDRTATNGTARAILQGRKYGLGCLLITQRTANVTKTILNQCNTVFAMRTFDETGKAFLSNYVGNDYASSLSAVPARHAVFFGKASTCENPVLIRLNDRENFTVAFRVVHPIPELPQPAEVVDDDIEDANDDFDIFE